MTGIVPPMPFQAGKTYTITVQANGFNPHLRVENPFGVPLAQTGGGGLTATLIYRPMATGQLRVIISSHSTKTGGFQLKIEESP